jgi:hypothetical protein
MTKELTDHEIDLFIQGFLLPPPFGFTEGEKKQIFDWIKTPSAFVEMAEKRRMKEPTQDELPVYDVLTGLIHSRLSFVALQIATEITKAAEFSEHKTCPSSESIQKIVEQVFRSYVSANDRS